MSSLTTCALMFISCASLIVLLFGGIVHTLPVAENPEEIGPYFEGDILLPVSSFLRTARLDKLWPYAIVPYEFAAGYPTTLRTTFKKAIEHISERSCLRFRERTPDDAHFVRVIAGSSCYARIGRQGGGQTLSLPASCNTLGTFVHEILHALGFYHEQSRLDRDQYVTILWKNILPGKDQQFNTHDRNLEVTSFGAPYDYDSIMHYSSTAFSKDQQRKLATIIPKDPSKSAGQLGQRRKLSRWDINKLNKLYSCDSSPVFDG